jgi:hypothetical protein
MHRMGFAVEENPVLRMITKRFGTGRWAPGLLLEWGITPRARASTSAMSVSELRSGVSG